MQGVSFIREKQVIEKILKRLELWDQKVRPPPKVNASPRTFEYHINYTNNRVSIIPAA
jgi:hypothetical protein